MGLEDGVGKRNGFPFSADGDKAAEPAGRMVMLRRSSSARETSAWGVRSELSPCEEEGSPLPPTAGKVKWAQLSGVGTVTEGPVHRQKLNRSSLKLRTRKQAEDEEGDGAEEQRGGSAGRHGIRKSDSFFRRLLHRGRVAPTPNLVCSLETILQLNPSHVATDSLERVPIVIDLLRLFDLNLAMAGVDEKDIAESYLCVVCRPMYMDSSYRRVRDLPLAELKSDLRPAVMVGEVAVDTQLTMVLSRRLYNCLSKMEIELRLLWESRSKLTRRRHQHQRTVATFSLDLLYIQREVAAEHTVSLFHGGGDHARRLPKGGSLPRSVAEAPPIDRQRFNSTASAAEFVYNATPSDRIH